MVDSGLDRKWDELSKILQNNRPFLLEVQASRIISDMVFAVGKYGEDPEVAARAGQIKAEELIERLGYRRW